MRLSSESWKTILGFLSEYFNLCYGEKYINFNKLITIYSLMEKGDKQSLATAFTIVYSLVVSGISRKIPLSDVLSLLGYTGPLLPIIRYSDNTIVPDFNLILGL
jgi:hypothetical protein